MKVLAFAASSSKQSINKKLVTYATSLLQNAEVEILDLNDYELPLFSEDREKEFGRPNLAKRFYNKIGEADALVISFAEHNGCYTAAYKNIYDWCSRINPKVFQRKPMVLLSTSPGKRGGASVLAIAVGSAPFFGGDLKGSYSVPEFYENFDQDSGQITNKEINDRIKLLMKRLDQL